MIGTTFQSLAEVVDDDRFPKIDLELRRGRHIGRDDGDEYTFLVEALDQLEPFYLRFGFQLVSKADGYIYLLPTGSGLSRSTLSVGEMLVGQTLALMYLDPSTLKQDGIVKRDALLQRLEGLVGTEKLIRALNPRLQRIDERVGAEAVRVKVRDALRTLKKLGFIELDGDRLALRPALLRFVEPVRDLSDPIAAIKRLVSAGEVRTRDLSRRSASAGEGAQASE